MTKVTVDIDDEALARVREIARARSLSVEDLLREQVDGLVGLAPFKVDNPSHRAILAALGNTNDGWREEVHDRAKARAEGYAENRAALMALARATEGDMGTDGWDRRRAYDP